MTPPTTTAGPAATPAEVVSVRASGRHHRVQLRVAGLVSARPGTFLSLAVGGVDPVHLLRRSYWIHRLTPGGIDTALVELVVRDQGRAGHWLCSLAPGATVQVVGPLGRPFALPTEPVACLLVGEGCSAAPLFGLAERLRERGAAVHLLLGGVDAADVLPAQDLRRAVRTVTVATADGSMGRAGAVTDVLPEVLASTGAAVVYAVAPAPATLHAVAAAAEQHGAWSQVALESGHPCGTGLCHGCGVPVVGEDGVPRTVRACTEGPVFRGDRVRWVEL